MEGTLIDTTTANTVDFREMITQLHSLSSPVCAPVESRMFVTTNRRTCIRLDDVDAVKNINRCLEIMVNLYLEAPATLPKDRCVNVLGEWCCLSISYQSE